MSPNAPGPMSPSAATPVSTTGLRSSGDGGVFVPSSLWIDQDNAGDEVAARRERGEITAETAEELRFFIDNGYLVRPLGVDEALLDAIPAAAARFWQEKPADLAYAFDGPARRMTHADEERERRSRSRIHDIHSHCDEALALYLHPRIYDFIELALGEEAVAIQSLYFEFGSQQLLHRDPVVVPIGEPGHMIAAWIALEDISPDCGPLTYVPGSHRLPYYELAPGEYQYDGRRMGPEVVEKGLAWEDEQYRRHGLEKKLFTPKKGEFLLWHASLSHGGSEVRDERLTRKSLVVHFTSRRTYEERSITIAEPGPDGDRQEVLATRELIERDGRRGFQNPMLG